MKNSPFKYNLNYKCTIMRFLWRQFQHLKKKKKKLFFSSPLWNTGWIKRSKWKISRSTLRKFRHLCMDALLNLLQLLFSIRKEKTHQKPKETVIKRSDTNCSSTILEFSNILQIMDLKWIKTISHTWRKGSCSFIYSITANDCPDTIYVAYTCIILFC